MPSMKNPRFVIAELLLLSAAFVLTVPVQTVTNVSGATNLSLELFLQVPKTVNPGQTIAIELWTVYNGDTLAFNATGIGTPCVNLFPCISFLVKSNLGISVPPHVHTPGGQFIVLPPMQQWVHPGAWNVSYTVPSQTGLYGVHLYANYTIGPGNSAVNEAATTFQVTSAAAAPATPASPTDVSNVGNSVSTVMTLVYGVLGLATIAVILDIVLLMRKRTGP